MHSGTVVVAVVVVVVDRQPSVKQENPFEVFQHELRALNLRPD